MKYLKVEWLHDFDDEPRLIYSELENSRSEKRKVEVFPDGTYGYASGEDFRGTTRLSETVIPTESEISKDPQFLTESITKEEFECMWLKATKN